MIIMKKILLGTSGLVAAVALYAGAAAAETPKVTVGGFVDFQAGIANDDLDAGQRAHGFRNDSEITFRADGKSDAGLNYGAEADLEADVTADADGQGLNASRTFVFLDGAFGRFELGSNTGASQALKVDATNVAAATGGINGAWSYFANIPTGGFITTPKLPLAHGSTAAIGSEVTDNNNKITYYSPRLSGVQLGISYAPDSADRGQTVSRADTNAGQSGDNFDVALSYADQFGDVSVAAAATSEFGSAETATTEDLTAWNVGGSVGYAGFSVAGSYGDWSDSLTANGTDASYWTAGLAYNVGAFGTSVTYLNSTIDTGTDSDFNNIVVGADYKLAPGLTPYAEVSVYDFDQAGAAADNNGTVVILGTQLAF
jgi:outer membrane protein OmpU